MLQSDISNLTRYHGQRTIVTAEKGCYSKRRTQQEIRTVFNLLLGFESFETFAASHEVFDVQDNIAIPVHLTATLKILFFNAGLINSPGSALSRKTNSSDV